MSTFEHDLPKIERIKKAKSSNLSFKDFEGGEALLETDRLTPEEAVEARFASFIIDKVDALGSTDPELEQVNAVSFERVADQPDIFEPTQIILTADQNEPGVTFYNARLIYRTHSSEINMTVGYETVPSIEGDDETEDIITDVALDLDRTPIETELDAITLGINRLEDMLARSYQQV